MLSAQAGDRFAPEAGRRFGLLTGAVFLPVRLGTGWAMTWHKGVTRASLAEPGSGRTLAARLGLFLVVLLAAAGHDAAHPRGRPERARARAVVSLVGPLGVVLPVAALPAT